MAGANINSPESLGSFIIAECGRHWGESHTPLALTALGSKIRRENLADNATLEDLAPNGLLKFILAAVIDEVNLRERVPGEGSWALVPKEIEFSDALFPARILKPPVSVISGTPRPTNYLNSVWAAFKNPIDETNKRYFSPDFSKFIDLQNGATPPPDHIEVQIGYLTKLSDDVAPDGLGIKSSIEKFLKDHNIALSKVTRPMAALPLTSRSSTSGIRSGSIHITANDLAFALGNLSPSDLARITVPLDIVIEMLRRRR